MSGPCVVLGGSQPGIYDVRPRGLAEKHWPYPFPIVIHCNNQTEAEKLYHIQEKHFKSAMTDDPPAHIVTQIVENLHDSRALGIIEGLLDVKSFHVVLYGRKTGIFFKWDQVYPLTHGFSGQQHKSFKTLADAIKYYCYKGAESLNVGGNVTDISENVDEAATEGLDNVMSQMSGLSLGESVSQSSGTARQRPQGRAESQAAYVRHLPVHAMPRNTTVNTHAHATSRPAVVHAPAAPHLPIRTCEQDMIRPYTQHFLPPPPRSTDRGAEQLLQPAEWVHYVERGFREVTRVHTGQRPALRDIPIASLGLLTDYYIETHGYDTETRLRIVQAITYSNSREEFTSTLAPYGANISEMDFLYYIYELGNL